MWVEFCETCTPKDHARIEVILPTVASSFSLEANSMTWFNDLVYDEEQNESMTTKKRLLNGKRSMLLSFWFWRCSKSPIR